LVANGAFEVLEGDQIEGAVIATFPKHARSEGLVFRRCLPASRSTPKKKGSIYQGILIEGLA